MLTTTMMMSPLAVRRLFAKLNGVRFRDGLCTCCATPRPAFRLGEDGDGEWGHADDSEYAEMRHVHVQSSSRDCDGLYDHGHVYTIPSIRAEALRPSYLHSHSGETPDFMDLWWYMVKHEPRGAYTEGEECTITLTSTRLEWNCTTEEGFASGDAWICDDPTCAHDSSTFRDHSAERAGY